ncbi:MAG TPA: hypothetical protein VM841_01590 [Actinomycetota bacterium]|nr:hypothetical protein [Actinomycetota bacterium]
MVLEPDTILFGTKGEDDWAFSPDVIARLDESSEGYLILEDEDRDVDPADDDEGWPVLPGNQIIWIDDGDEAEPLAIVSADRAGAQEALEEVAHEWARGEDAVEIEIDSSGNITAIFRDE